MRAVYLSAVNGSDAVSRTSIHLTGLIAAYHASGIGSYQSGCATGHTRMAAGVYYTAVGSYKGSLGAGHVTVYPATSNQAGVAVGKRAAAGYGADSGYLQLAYHCILTKSGKQRLAVQAVHITVADLIASTSAASHRLAMNQMKGGFSRELRSLRDQLLQFTSLIELELDFSEEDVEFADRSQLEQLAEQIDQIITRLAQSFSTGDAIRNGVPVAIIGQTNTGKSTLLNQLLHDDRALVSDIQGTTRDSIEDTTTIGGVLFRFIDTAGIRQTTDTVESMGIERSYRKAREAGIILWMTDEAHPADVETENKIRELSEGKHLIRVHNKCDDSSALPQPTDTDVWISAKYGYGLEQLNDLLIKAAAIPQISEQDVIVTNMRHYESLVKAQECIRRVRQGLRDRISGDFLSQDIRQCIHHLSTITGDITTDDILGNIFSHFCIGK